MGLITLIHSAHNHNILRLLVSNVHFLELIHRQKAMNKPECYKNYTLTLGDEEKK